MALRGADALINAAGPVKGGNPRLMASLASLIGGHIQKGLNRVVWLSGAGVKLPGDRPDAMRTIVRGLMKLVAGAVLRDSETGVKTAFRVPMLSDEATKGELVLSDQPSRPVAAGRNDVAQLLIDQVTDSGWAGKAPYAGVR